MKIGSVITLDRRKFKVEKVEDTFRYFSEEFDTWKTATRYALVEVVNSPLFRAHKDSIVVW